MEDLHTHGALFQSLLNIVDFQISKAEFAHNCKGKYIFCVVYQYQDCICASCSAPSKYRCPKCSTLSCSLKCVKAHKLEKDCDGIREKTAYVPVVEFKDRHLLSDYHFLEEIHRTVDNASRAKKAHGCFHYLPPPLVGVQVKWIHCVCKTVIPKCENLYRLKMAAKARKTDLQILPIIFAKRKISTTYIRYSDRKILWRIEWSFPLCNFTCVDERIDEEMLLGKCLDKYLLPESSESTRDKLQYYHSMGHSGVAVLLKNENCTANDIKYYILKQNKSLKKNFQGKRIIEFPTLLIVPKIHLSYYPTVE